MTYYALTQERSSRWKEQAARNGVAWSDDDVARALSFLNAVAAEKGEPLTDKEVVEAARPADSPLHPLIDWSDAIATARLDPDD